jgi:thioredoxin 2
MPIVACSSCGARNRVEDRGPGVRPVCGRCGGALASAPGVPVTLTDRDFAGFLASAGRTPVLVDCWAPWCGPCRILTPTIDALAAEAGLRFRIAKLNTDENPVVAGQFGIRSIPTLLVFKEGRLVDQMMGVQPKSAILACILGHVDGARQKAA